MTFLVVSTKTDTYKAAGVLKAMHLTICANMFDSRGTRQNGLTLLTIQRLDSTVDFSVVVVCEVSMIDSAKMTCGKNRERVLATAPHIAYTKLHHKFFVSHKDSGQFLPFPMI